MSPLELKLKREFKELQKNIEDYWLDDGYTKVHNFTDEICYAKYIEIKEMVKAIIGSINDTNLKELNDKVDNFNTIVINFKNYLFAEEGKCKFRNHLLDECSGDTKDILNEMNKLQAIAYYNSYQKLANQIDCMARQTIGRITYILNEAMEQVLSPYITLINAEILKLKNSILIKVEESDAEELPSTPNKKNKTTEKIFNYKELNKLLENQGFQEIRQTGDHKIYNNGSKSIPVPQHSLGKGLSCKIQKEI